MSKPIRWLLAEVDRWTNEGLITAEQAAQLRARYPDTETKTSWGLIVFSGLGAVVVGLGVILLLAYNWKDIPKFGKLALIFGSIATAHGAALWLRWGKTARPELGEAISLLGSMLFGAGIWLVAQVYNIDEHFPTGFLIWGIGALMLAWALDSIPQAILATVVLTIWGCTEFFGFNRPADFASVILLVGVGPLVGRRQSALLGAILLKALFILIVAYAGYWNGSGGAFTAALSLSTLLIAVVRVLPLETIDARLRRVLLFFGLTGFVICSYILSFDDAVRDALRWTDEHQRAGSVAVIYRWSLFALSVTGWGWLAIRRWTKPSANAVKTEEWLCPIALLYCQGIAAVGTPADAGFVAAVFNFVCLGIACMWMVRGCRTGELRSVILGSLLFAALAFARYFDLFESLAWRGLTFLIVGGVLFAEGFFYRRLRQASDSTGGDS